jgi:hypothetical protein
MLNKDSEKEKSIIPIEVVSQRIFFIRGVKVILDVDLAEFYGVSVKRLNEQIKRNAERFPIDFMFQLTKDELDNLRSQFATSSWGGRRYLPYAFTEHGTAMLASVLKSKRATEMSIFIVRTFIKIREILASNKDLAHQIEELQREQKLQNKHINSIYSLIDKLIEQPQKHENKIGFRR